MTLVIDSHPILYAVAMAMVAAFFIGLTLFLLVLGARNWRRATREKQRFEARRQTIIMSVSSIFIIAFTAMSWIAADPHTVVLSEDAMELRYLLSSRRIPYSEIRRIEFGMHRDRGFRAVERQSVTLRTADASFDVTSEVHPPSRLTVRKLFEELTRRVPGATVPPESKATWERARDQAAKRGY
jgi:hypothetical protein